MSTDDSTLIEVDSRKRVSLGKYFKPGTLLRATLEDDGIIILEEVATFTSAELAAKAEDRA